MQPEWNHDGAVSLVCCRLMRNARRVLRATGKHGSAGVALGWAPPGCLSGPLHCCAVCRVIQPQKSRPDKVEERRALPGFGAWRVGAAGAAGAAGCDTALEAGSWELGAGSWKPETGRCLLGSSVGGLPIVARPPRGMGAFAPKPPPAARERRQTFTPLSQPAADEPLSGAHLASLLLGPRSDHRQTPRDASTPAPPALPPSTRTRVQRSPERPPPRGSIVAVRLCPFRPGGPRLCFFSAAPGGGKWRRGLGRARR
jgi:hypothetical protein